ncbi:hypothetical protein EXIGLDRAFT_776869 [Exidia glandulosa HHB12029]|uniref:Uncharacterized protein n=1 Tax=Exidia glandulosa HHB12029 TaxID=1314781 RepID=A0A165DAD3_EXIGL|nr:hypothetical protein EXIGLDRAFT_776869 [Exidia glandulosa HHB12029]
MQTLEEPVSFDWPVPPAGSEEYGQYVIISYDPVASVAVLEDEEASRAAAALPRRKHLAVAISTGCISLRNADDVQRLTLEFHLMSEDLPPTEDGAYSIPVTPETTHPLDRPPIVPSIPLPWPNFYIETLSNFACIVSRIYYDPLKAYPHMGMEQQDQVLLYAIEDQRVSTERRLAASFPGVAHPNGAVLIGDGDSEISRTDDSESDEDIQYDNKEIAAIYQKVEQLHIHVEIWTDLSSVDPHSLGRAADFFSQVGQVEQLFSDYESRMLARTLSKPGTGEWAKSVADAPQLLEVQIVAAWTLELLQTMMEMKAVSKSSLLVCAMFSTVRF